MKPIKPLDFLSELRTDNQCRKSLQILKEMNEDDVDRLIAILNRRKDLEQLYFNETGINDKMATKIADNALRNSHKTLKKLSFHDNLLGDQGAIKIVNAVKCNKALRVLDLSKNHITAWGLTQLFKDLIFNDNLRELNLSKNFNQPILENYDRKPLINFLRRNTSLEKLDVGWTEIFDKPAMLALKNNEKMNLKFLGLSWCKISKDLAETLAELVTKRSLESLDLTELFQDDSMDLIFNALGENKTLKSLKIDANIMSKKEIDALAQFLKGNLMLESLSLNRTFTRFTSVYLRPLWERLTGNNILKVLNFNSNSLGVEGATALSNLLKTNPGLEELNLSKSEIGDKELAILVKSWKDNTHLKKLDLSENELGVEGFAALVQGLNTNTTLKVLNLSFTQLSSNHIKQLQIKQLDKVLQGSRLEELNVSGNALGRDGVVIVAKCLENNLHIKKLYLNECGIDSEGAFALAELLEKNSNLEELHLTDNHIGSHGLIALCKSLNKINNDKDKKGVFRVLKLTVRNIKQITDEHVMSALKSGKIVLVNEESTHKVSSYFFNNAVVPVQAPVTVNDPDPDPNLDPYDNMKEFSLNY